MERKVYSVQQVNSYIKSVLEDDLVLNCVNITGEISNYKSHPSGHLYFTLKDENAALKCVMFKSSAWELDFKPENGIKVIICGRVSIYEKTGDIQLYADFMKKAGTGGLYESFEKLKLKLMEEGLFDEERKRKIPSYVRCVAVVTSGSGAAVRDIIQIIKRRNKYIKITIAPVLVQGEGAATQIAYAIGYVNNWGGADCIIVGRGGGSFEDLQAFNEEIVARSIANSRIPVISAVGHETDFTIADFVADMRAPTPSAAAELVSFSLDEMYDNIKRSLLKIERTVNIRLSNYLQRINSLINRRALKSPAECVYNRQIYVHTLQKRAAAIVNSRILKAKTEVGFNVAAASNLSPLKTLLRGYAVVLSHEGKLIKEIDEIPLNKIKVLMRDGYLNAMVIEKEKSDTAQDMPSWFN